MKRLTILTLVLAVGMFLAVGVNTSRAANTWYYQVTNAGDLVAGETFNAEIYFINADNGDPDVGNDGKHNLNIYGLDLDYNLDLLQYQRVRYVDHYAPDWSYMLFDGGFLPSQPTEDPQGYLYDIMGMENLDHRREFYPDDALDPNSYNMPPDPPCPGEPFNHLATVKFTAKVTGHYDDLGMVWSAPDQDCLARVDWDTYDQADNFTAWTDGDWANGTWVYDSDEDGVIDGEDNCRLTANADQRDTDNDGYGNICDCDLNNDGWVTSIDRSMFRRAFNTTGPGLDSDFNGDEVVDGNDRDIIRSRYGSSAPFE